MYYYFWSLISISANHCPMSLNSSFSQILSDVTHFFQPLNIDHHSPVSGFSLPWDEFNFIFQMKLLQGGESFLNAVLIDWLVYGQWQKLKSIDLRNKRDIIIIIANNIII